MNAAASITALPLPLPEDVDLSGMPHMPMFDERLVRSRSWLRAKNWRGDGPGLGFCLFNLWARAFRDVPAGSIENDDDVLAEAARCDIAHWMSMKDKALLGWQLHDDRWHHPVVSQIVWDLWKGRLRIIHEKATDSQRAAAKRAHDKGREPPPPIPHFEAWLDERYPATAAYIRALAARLPASSSERPSDNGESPLDIAPKRSEAKGESPLSSPVPVPVEGPDGLGRKLRRAPSKAGKAWFAGEHARLEQQFRAHAGRMADIAGGETAAVPVKFSFVERFKGCWVIGSGGSNPTILFPTKRRADAFAAERGPLMATWMPGWQWRHATVDELRSFKQQNGAAAA